MTPVPVDDNTVRDARHTARSGVVIVEAEDGALGWHAVDINGPAPAPHFGKIYGLDGDRASAAKYELSRKVIETALRSMLVANRKRLPTVPAGRTDRD